MPTPESNLVNHEPVEVLLVPASGKTEPRKESVALKLRLSIRERYQFARHVRGEQTPELVALCTGKSVEWVDELTPESFAELASRAIKQNFPIAQAMAEKDPVMAAIIGPVVANGIMAIALMLPAMTPPKTTENPGAPSSDSSPAPAPSGSAEATGSASST